MADRTVTVVLKGDIKPYLSAVSQAEAATKRLRGEMSKTVTLHADADIRDASRKLDDLADEADRLDGDTVTIAADADVYDAMATLGRLSDELGDLDGRKAVVRVDVDTAGAMPKLADLSQAVGGAVTAGARAGGPALIAALGGLAATVGPMAGAAIGGAIVAGIGAKLAILGGESLFYIQEIDKSWSAVEKKRVEEANKQAKELQDQFRELGRDLTLAMQEAADPMRSVLDEVRVAARDVAKDVGPNLARGFEQARVPLEQFVRDLGAGLKDLGKAIPSIMDGFGDVLGEIDIKGLLSDLGREFDELGRTVSANRSTIGAVLNGLLDVIPLAIDGIGKVIEFFGKMSLAVMTSAAAISEHMAGLTGVITGVGTRVLEVVRTIGQALSNVPGMEEFGRKIVEGADAGIRKLQEFQKHADEASRAIRLSADIMDLQQKIDTALTLLDDPNLSKERRAQIGAEIDRLQRAKAQALLELGDPKLIAEYKSQITTDITSLQSRLADARKELKDPELTKERKSKLNAEISQLEAAVKRAKSALDSIKDKTVTITSIYQSKSGQDALNKKQSMGAAQGAIVRYAAAGGIASYASGGMKPHVVSKPTAIVYGEGSSGQGALEAFIPLTEYKPQAIELLGQVADHFGLALYNKQAAAQISGLSQSVTWSAGQIDVAMGGAIDMLDVTLGQSGSLTSALAGVGESASEMGALVSVSMSGAADTMAGSIDGLSESVAYLGDAVAAAQEMTSSTSTGGKKKSGKKKSVWQSELDQLQDLLTGGKKPAPKPVPVVWGDNQIGVHIGGAMDAPTNYSKVSKPQMVGGGSGGLPGVYGSGGAAGGGSGGATVNKSVNFYGGQTIKETADADVLFKQASLHLGDRG